MGGAVTRGGVVEGLNPKIRAQGRRGVNFSGDSLDDTPTWFITNELPPDKIGIEHLVPYFSGDIAWGAEPAAEIVEDTSLASIVTIYDQTGLAEDMYDLVRQYYERCTDPMAHPPLDDSLMAPILPDYHAVNYQPLKQVGCLVHSALPYGKGVFYRRFKGQTHSYRLFDRFRMRFGMGPILWAQNRTRTIDLFCVREAL